MSSLSFSKINFNLYVSSGNKITNNNYSLTLLPKDAGNNAPLIKYGDDYFIPLSVGLVRYTQNNNTIHYFVIETKCEKNNKVFYLCIPIENQVNSSNSISDYLRQIASTDSTVVNFDIQTVIVSNDAKIKAIGDPNHYTCVINETLGVANLTAFARDTNLQTNHFKNLQLPLPGDATPIQLASGTLQTRMSCRRATGTDEADNKTVVEDTPDQLMNRMMTIIGFIAAILIVYSFMFEWMLTNLIIQFMDDENGLTRGLPFVGYYFGVITVLFGVSLLIYSAVHRSSLHMYSGISMFVLVGLTQFLYGKIPKQDSQNIQNFSIGQTWKSISELQDIKIWAFGFPVIIILMLVATFTSFIPDYKYADTVSFAIFGLAISWFCFPIDQPFAIRTLYWWRFAVVFSLVLVGSILWGIYHADVYIPS